MMQEPIRLKYGTSEQTFIVPETIDKLIIKEPEFSIDKQQFLSDFKQALPSSTGAGQRISIVVADKTRLCGYDIYLPWVLESLSEKGITKEDITFFIAYGTHARQSDEESLAAYGDTYETHSFVHHDCSEKNVFKSMGSTSNETPVKFRKDVLNSDLIITFGALSHHYFAGYGGGRKLLFPGLGYKTDIYKNHSLFLDKKAGQLSPGCQPGNLAGNPLAEDLKQIYTFMTRPKINIHGILNSNGKVCELIVGKTYDDFLNACTHLDSFYKAPQTDQYELVIASCGGFPKDINLIQAHKAINNAAMFVKDGGNLIVLTQCKDGVGSITFLPYFETDSFDQAFNTLEKDYQGNGGTALSMMTKTRRINIFLKTRLDDTICSTIGVNKLTEETANKLIQQADGDIACIENASLVIR